MSGSTQMMNLKKINNKADQNIMYQNVKGGYICMLRLWLIFFFTICIFKDEYALLLQ